VQRGPFQYQSWNWQTGWHPYTPYLVVIFEFIAVVQF
jgi:hypothetical protein